MITFENVSKRYPDGTVAVDGSGAPLRPAVIWMDSRGNTAMRRQMGGKVSVLGYDVRKIQRWIRLTGGAIEGMSFEEGLRRSARLTSGEL